MTEPLLLQQLESPSGTGRDEPRSQTTLPDSQQQQTRMQPTPALSLAGMCSYADARCEYLRWAACFETPSIVPISDQDR